MMKQFFLALAAALFLTGCCNIEYTGKEQAPLRSGNDTVLYFSPDQYPPNTVQEVLGIVSKLPQFQACKIML